MPTARKPPRKGEGRFAPRAIVPLGDTAVLIDFSEEIDLPVNMFIQRLAHVIHARRAPWIRDVVPAFTTLALHLDPDHADAHDPVHAAWALVEACIDQAQAAHTPPRAIDVPICYDADLGFEMDAIVKATGLPAEEVIRRHAASAFRVLVVGFAPGHPYLGGLDPMLSMPRRATPRASTPIGSVAIANLQCAVYPFELPGGWSVLGRTPLRLFDAGRDHPSLFEPGDLVRFVPIGREEFDRLERGERPAATDA